MKVITSLLLTAMPAAAYAGECRPMGMNGAYHGHIFIVLYAAIAALGYWVARNAAKDTSACVKRVGITVSVVLVVVGLLGVLCGVAGHVRNSCRACCRHEQPMMEQPAPEAKPVAAAPAPAAPELSRKKAK
jgi:hypothetical protein